MPFVQYDTPERAGRPGAATFHLRYSVRCETRDWHSIRDSLCTNHLYRYYVQLEFLCQPATPAKFLVPHS